MRKLIRSFINTLGYDVVKTNKWTEKSKKKAIVRVGNYDILMPPNNLQIHNYKNIPNLNIDLAKLAKTIATKYSNLCVIDVGANVGDTIAVIKSEIDIPIIAIEGDNTSYQFLEINSKKFNQITVINSFLGETQSEINVNIEKKGWNNTLVPDANAATKITLQTLDSILLVNGLQTRNNKLLKIDTEGFDTIILRGCKKLLEQNKPVVYFEFNAENMKAIGEDGIKTLLGMKTFGYASVLIFDGLSNLIVSTTLHDKALLVQLNNYIHNDSALVRFYDICVFHEEDFDLVEQFLKYF